MTASHDGLPADGRALSDRTTDLRSVRGLLATVLRYAPFIAAASILAAFAMAALAKISEREVAARSRVMLTSEVLWPYYDAVRDQQVELVAQPETLTEVAKRIADVGAVHKLETSVPTGQAFIDIEATASSTAAAVAAANAAAQYLVERDNATVFGTLEVQRDRAFADLAEIDANIAAMTEELESLEPRIAELQRAIAVVAPSVADLTEVRVLEDRRTSLLEHRAVETSRRGRAIFAADTASTELRNTTGRLAILREAYRTATDPGRTRGLVLVAAASTAFVATLIAIGYDASYPRIRSRRHAETGAARGFSVVAAIDDAGGTLYVNEILERRPPRGVIGIASAHLSSSASSTAVSVITAVLRDSGVRTVTIGESAMAPAAAARVSLDGLAARNGDPKRQSTDDLLLELRDGLASSNHVHVDVDSYLASGGIIDGALGLRGVVRAAAEHADVVIVDCGTPGDTSRRWRALAGVCDTVVLLVEPRRTRQSQLRKALAHARDRRTIHVLVSFGLPQVVIRRPRPTAT